MDCVCVVQKAGLTNSNPEYLLFGLHPHRSLLSTRQELRDRNDELSSQLELLKTQRSDRKSRPSVDTTTLSWTQDSDSGNTTTQYTRHLKEQVYIARVLVVAQI